MARKKKNTINITLSVPKLRLPKFKLKKKTKKLIKEILVHTAAAVFVVLVFLNGLGFLTGFIEASTNPKDIGSMCLNKPVRLTAIIPAYKFGCFVGSNQKTWWWKESLGSSNLVMSGTHNYKFASKKDKKNFTEFTGWANTWYNVDSWFTQSLSFWSDKEKSCESRGGSRNLSGFNLRFTADKKILAHHTCVFETKK